ncbi:Solitary outer membrane autotransporter beta-barrel domain [Marinobacter sp. F4206]|nr:Solitary outer membrane autotransporter beta-barrel domain [Marinobacter sp. F4206]
MPGGLSFPDSVSFGINLNYGSVRRGGTLVLLFNED